MFKKPTFLVEFLLKKMFIESLKNLKMKIKLLGKSIIIFILIGYSTNNAKSIHIRNSLHNQLTIYHRIIHNSGKNTQDIFHEFISNNCPLEFLTHGEGPRSTQKR